MSQRSVYLDHNATTPMHPAVKQAMITAMEVYGNPSSLHEPGRMARRLVEHARAQCAGLINVPTEDLVFCGSGSEANNTVLNLFPCPGYGCEGSCPGRSELITTRVEHPCVLETATCLAKRGQQVRWLDVDARGRIDPDQLRDLLSDRTALVSIMLANNEIGTVQNLAELVPMVHEAGAFFHTDAVQAVGKIPVDATALGVDFLSFSAHKCYGPKGVGGLYVRKGVHFCPFIMGGHQEHGRRAGTENTLGIVGMGEAMAQRKNEMAAEADRLHALRQRLQAGIEARIEDIRINGDAVDSLPGTLNVSFAGCEGEALLLYLDLDGIAASTGSACSSGSLDPSHVLLACGLEPEHAHGSLRLSLGRTTTADEIDYVLDRLEATVRRVREMSTTFR
ncbi:MAG: cysteine desulfurase family protein [Planctomycetota bacterium]